MANFTSRFGLSFFGGQIPGSLSDDGQKFTLDDPQILDKILAAFETHTHAGGERLSDPADPPAAELSTGGGSLPADSTYYYSVSFLDQYGLETRASDEVAVDTPASLAVPASPSAEAVEGGSLTVGLYYYALTVVTDTDETQLSAPTLASVTEGSNTVVVTLPILPADAESFRVWRQGPGESGFTKIGLTSDFTFLDDGTIPPDPCPTDPANLPPTANSTNSTNSVTITLSDADQVPINAEDRPVKAWRLYRTTVSGNYGAASLVQEVTDRQVDGDDTSPLVVTWTDDGADTVSGQPRLFSQTLRPSQPFQLPVVTELPDPADYGEGYPLLFQGNLWVRYQADWHQASGTGGGGGGGGGTVAQNSAWPDLIFTGADGRRWRQTINATGQAVYVETLLPGAPTPPTNLVIS